MQKLKYTKAHPSRIRELSVETLEQLGIRRETGFRWSIANHHTVEVSNENAQILLDKLPGEFEVVTGDPEEDQQELDLPPGTPEVVAPPAEDEKSDEDETPESADEPEGDPKG